MNTCACGCGTPVRSTWVLGHHLRGTTGHNAGRKHPDHARRMQGTANPRWAGDKVGNTGLHKWVINHKPRTRICEHCGKKGRTDMANVSGEYRRDVNDF